MLSAWRSERPAEVLDLGGAARRTSTDTTSKRTSAGARRSPPATGPPAGAAGGPWRARPPRPVGRSRARAGSSPRRTTSTSPSHAMMSISPGRAPPVAGHDPQPGLREVPGRDPLAVRADRLPYRRHGAERDRGGRPADAGSPAAVDGGRPPVDGTTDPGRSAMASPERIGISGVIRRKPVILAGQPRRRRIACGRGRTYGPSPRPGAALAGRRATVRRTTAAGYLPGRRPIGYRSRGQGRLRRSTGSRSARPPATPASTAGARRTYQDPPQEPSWRSHEPTLLPTARPQHAPPAAHCLRRSSRYRRLRRRRSIRWRACSRSPATRSGRCRASRWRRRPADASGHSA